jgi:hypothetical protein
MKTKSTVHSPQSTVQADTPRLRRCIARFLREHAAASYCELGADVLDEYLEFHMAQNTLAYAHRQPAGGLLITPEIRAVAIAWQCWKDEVLAAEEAGGENPFRWKPSNPEGDCIFIGNITAREPLALAGMMLTLSRRFPHWSRLQLYAFRHGRTQPLSPTRMQRLYERSIHHG